MVAPLAHGLGTERVCPDWPVLTAEEIAALLADYPGAAPAGAILFQSPRPFSAAALGGSGIGPLFVKRHHRAVRDLPGLFEEHRFIAHLRAAGLAVPEVLANAGGATATARGDWVYEVHRPVRGEDLYRDALSWTPFLSADHARAAGRALARLHLAAAGYDAPARPVRPLVSSFSIFAAPDPGPVLDRYVAARPDLARYLDGRPGWRQALLEPLAPWHARLRPFLRGLSPLWTHNDWHASNLTWAADGREVAEILDFGLADRTTALFDLATAIERNGILWLALPERAGDPGIVETGQIDALLAGYHALRPLSPCDLDALAALLPLVHVEFALSETDYFFGVTRSAENASVAFDTYLLGHAAWFATAPGRALLDRIARWRGGDVSA
ncbi:MAG: phosphotransferase [Telmatospirillum sp.]|nr:phosphotransferase [Telmatospirillum sp.]